ncbi:MAG TPA: DNA polymerase domain-containing protein, partial [Terriglobales bacterium]|nr:DNA polymerase domain-containing protein [Terriglobales bacterium]
MNCRFFFLDVNEGHWEGKACVRFWGVDGDGKRVMIMANQIAPYFYFLPPKPVDVQLLRSKLSESKKLSKPAELTIENRRLLGREQSFLKVTCSEPSDVSGYSREIRKILGGGQCFDELRLPVRYLTDCGLIPCGWNECEVQLTSVSDLIADRVYVTTALPHSVRNARPPKLRTLAFSILTIGDKGSAKPQTDPIRAIAIAMDTGESQLLETSGNDDDSALLKGFVERVKKFDPDIIVGFGANAVQWQYLIERAKQVKETLEVGRDESEPHTSVFGHVSILGRANLDLSDLLDGIPEIKIKTIENAAKFFQLPDADKITTLDEWDQFEVWSGEGGKERLLENTRLTAKACLDFASTAVEYPMQLSAITGLPLDQVMAAAIGFRVDSYFIRRAHEIGELIPAKNEQPYFTFRGATVLEPETGLHENVVVLDFASMYPNLMKKYNLSPETLVKPGESILESSVYVIPEVGHRFKKEPDGFYKLVLTSLIQERDAIRKEIESQPPRSTMHRVLKERERAVKIITNACYGYAGWAGSRWYVKEVAESATALGRETIGKTVEKAKALDLHVIYSDTDSIFVTNDPPKISRLLDWVKAELELEIKIEREYTRVLFTEAMKRYAGLQNDGTLDIVGLEAIRGDWSDLARRVQEDVLVRVLKDQSTDKAVQGVRETIQLLRKGEIPISELTIRKTLTKPIEKYEVRVPHVEVARQLMKEGWDLTLGDKVAYVIAKGSGPLHKRARPRSRLKPDEVDYEYYVENQVKPAAMRIL